MEKLKRSRGAAKGKITRLANYLEKCQDGTESYNAEAVSTRIKGLEGAWNEFNEIHNQITQEAEADELAAEEKEYEETEMKFYTVDAGLRRILALVFGNTSRSSSRSSNGSGGNEDETGNGSARGAAPTSDVKLPRMNLPTFSGNQLDWTAFHDLFNSIVHSNQKISDVQKLHYLKNSLTDEAAGLLHSVDVTDANYAEAWKMLKERYQNERQLIHCHLKTLFSQPTLNNESGKNLRTLLDTTQKHVRALRSLKLETDHWDPILVFMVTDRLDAESRKQWELTSSSTVYPNFEELKKFLEKRCRALEATGEVNAKSTNSSTKVKNSTQSYHASSVSSCPVCQGDHPIYHCSEFTKLDVKGKTEIVKRLRLCFNCLRGIHAARQCTSKYTCKICKGKHNVLLHVDRPRKSTDNSSSLSTVSSLFSDHDADSQVLLSTIVLKVKDSSGNFQDCRALLDNGSQASFITEATVQRLGIMRSSARVTVTGIGSSGSGDTRGICNIMIASATSNFKMSMDVLVLKKLTNNIPTSSINIEDWSHLNNLKLADASFNNPGRIDILLGADVYEEIVDCVKIVGPDGMPSARSTRFGWTVSGRIGHQHGCRILSHVSTVDLGDQLRKFWELEEITSERKLTNEEENCESHFNLTYSRDETGRFITALPFKENKVSLGLSKELALKRFYNVEKRLEKFPKYKEEYTKFMDQYLEMGHMEKVPQAQCVEILNKTNYLPHHFVLKETSSTTSFRVVFDASMKTTNGLSLNDNLMIGPKLQDDMYFNLLRFRMFKYAFTSDIAKMYRQIKVREEDADFQRILWRKSSSSPIEEYRLVTVTYGTASAPYVAVKVLQQLAKEECGTHPLSNIITRNFYMDDLMGGCDDLDEAKQTQQQLIAVMAKGGFQLRKWSSNEEKLLEILPREFRETSLPLCIDLTDSIKALGLHWNPASDLFFFIVNLPEETKETNKRVILSETSRLFDPLGWLAPVLVRAKIMLQKFWMLGINWDEPLPKDLEDSWKQFRKELFCLHEIRINRHVFRGKVMTKQLHGFCDASEKAYAAAIYMRSENDDGTILVKLICAKTKVAPVKQISIPRLELCGALLLARLLDKVKRAIGCQIESVYAWSDSTVTLDWISGHPNRWKTFVGNRTSEIQQLLDPGCWRHVPTFDNPADHASRGVNADELMNLRIWWNGPSWLSLDQVYWPIRSSTTEDNPSSCELKSIKVLTVEVLPTWDLIQKYSSLSKLIRVTAYCIRFINKLKKKSSATEISNPSSTYGLSSEELQQAKKFWIKVVQWERFSTTITALKTGKKLPNDLMQLNPFLDTNEILRVGGRIQFASVKYDQKHPIILPKKHHFTNLVVENEHIKQLHAGAQLLLSCLQQSFWVIHGRSTIRKIIHKCVKCFRDKATPTHQQMGDLPGTRVQSARPFLKVGVDFAGPITTKSMKGRGGKLLKSHISLFVCMSTKAVHLELVGDLTSESFIATLRRFMARRGKCSDIYSDNGSNFIGADNELKELSKLVKKQWNHEIIPFLANEEINWHYIPARAPHFGGLWEAGVKSVKKHLRRVIGESTLTFEEMSTVLTQIEACLNSRPLCPVSTDPNDLAALTPGHFIIGEPLTATPEPDLTELKINRLSRWQLSQQIVQHFWKRWHKEYLGHLQQRPKWTGIVNNIKVGDMVIVKEDNIPPLKWPLGRIIETHPGKDNCVRVVTVKTKSGNFKRPIVKICKLPFDS